MVLESIAKGALVAGIEEGRVVCFVSADPLGDNAVTVVFKIDDGRLGERVLFRSNESEITVATAGRPYSFDADGTGFLRLSSAQPKEAQAGLIGTVAYEKRSERCRGIAADDEQPDPEMSIDRCKVL